MPTRRARYQELDQVPLWSRIPRRYKVLAVALVLFVIGATFHREIIDHLASLLPRTARIELRAPDGSVAPFAGRADVFVIDRTRYLPSPLPQLGSLPLDGLGDSLVLDSRRFPKSIQVRFHVPGYGVDVVSVELGQRRTLTLRLGSPVEVKGVVRGPDRSPIEGARILAFALHPRGVLLAEATSDAQGSYTLTGISARVGFLVLRVLKPGYAMVEREHWFAAASYETASKTDFDLEPTPPALGRLLFQGAVPTMPLVVSLLDVPGVSSAVATDGAFVLHHLRAGMRYRVLVQGLPDGFTHRLTHARAGERCEVLVGPCLALRGEVFSKRGGCALAGVRLHHEESNRGIEVTTTDEGGRFTIPRVPHGALVLALEVPDGPLYRGGLVTRREVQIEPTSGRLRIEID